MSKESLTNLWKPNCTVDVWPWCDETSSAAQRRQREAVSVWRILQSWSLRMPPRRLQLRRRWGQCPIASFPPGLVFSFTSLGVLMTFHVLCSVFGLGMPVSRRRGSQGSPVRLCCRWRQHLHVRRAAGGRANRRPPGLQHRLKTHPESFLSRENEACWTEVWILTLFQCLSPGLRLKPADRFLLPCETQSDQITLIHFNHWVTSWIFISSVSASPDGGRVSLRLEISSSCLEVTEQEERFVRTFMLWTQVNFGSGWDPLWSNTSWHNMCLF